MLSKARAGQGAQRSQGSRDHIYRAGAVSSVALKDRSLWKGRGNLRVNVIMSVDYFKPHGGKINYK